MGLPPGEAVKNLVHRVAAEQDFAEIEELGLEICGRIMLVAFSLTGACDARSSCITRLPWRTVDSRRQACRFDHLRVGTALLSSQR